MLISKKYLAIVIISLVVLVSILGVFLSNLVSTNNAPATAYARQKELPLSISYQNLDCSWLARAREDGFREKAILDYASQLDNPYQETFLNSLIPVNNTFAEYHQVQFLSSLQKNDQLKIIGDGNTANFDIDNDGMNNYFEHYIAGWPYDEPFERYALIVDTNNPYPYGGGAYLSEGYSMRKFLINQEHFRPTNVVQLCGVNATIQNFQSAISELSRKVSTDDLFFFSMSAHGGAGFICFNDGKGNNQGWSAVMNYSDMAKSFSVLNPKAAFMAIFACDVETGIPVVADQKYPVVAVRVEPAWIFDTSSVYPNVFQNCSTATLKKVYDYPGYVYDFELMQGYLYLDIDLDKNGYVSVGEIVKTSLYGYNEICSNGSTPISDKNKIADSWYLGDFNVDDQY